MQLKVVVQTAGAGFMHSDFQMRWCCFRFDRRVGGGESRPHCGPPHHQPGEGAGDGVQQAIQISGNNHSPEKSEQIKENKSNIYKKCSATPSLTIGVLPATFQVHSLDPCPRLCQGHRSLPLPP